MRSCVPSASSAAWVGHGRLEHRCTLSVSGRNALFVVGKSRARAAETGADQRLNAARTTFRREALDAFNEADATARLRAQEFAIASEHNRRTILTAPSAGIVQQLQVTTIGAVVRPADALLVIVPEGTRLVVEADVLNRDAGFVREGQEVRVKLEAFPFTRYGIMSGPLVFLSHDAIEDEELGLVFPARVELSQQSISVNGRATPLTAGMAVTAGSRAGRKGPLSCANGGRHCQVWKTALSPAQLPPSGRIIDIAVSAAWVLRLSKDSQPVPRPFLCV